MTLFLALLVGCHSRAGLFGSFVGVALVLCFYLERSKKFFVNLALFMATTTVVFPLLDNGSLAGRLRGLWVHEIPALLAQKNGEDPINGKGPRVELSVKSGVVFARVGNRALVLHNTAQGFRALSHTGQSISFQTQGFGYQSTHADYPDLSLSLRGHPSGLRVVQLNWPPLSYDFSLSEEGFQFFAWGKAHESVVAARSDLIPSDHLISGRGYIWARSIPLLQEKWLGGYGYGTFPYHFPQNDFAARFQAFRNVKQLIDKPHNMYLQIALAGGVLSLLFFTVILTMVVFAGTWHAWQLKLHSRLFAANAPKHAFSTIWFLTAGVMGYLVCGLANDSSIFVAPVFWAVCGTILGCARAAPNFGRPKRSFNTRDTTVIG